MRPTTHALLITLAIVGLMTLGGYFADQFLTQDACAESAELAVRASAT